MKQGANTEANNLYVTSRLYNTQVLSKTGSYITRVLCIKSQVILLSINGPINIPSLYKYQVTVTYPINFLFEYSFLLLEFSTPGT